jgi:phage terminase large subunit-like protein
MSSLVLDLSGLPADVIDSLYSGIAALHDLRRFNALSYFQPYPKQLAFYRAGATKPERCLSAGNQYGKTIAGSTEAAYHLTGLYPTWWEGRRFTKPVKAWACGETSEKCRDNVQAKLCGDPGIASGPEAPGWGTGFIPRYALLSRTLSHGITNAFDGIHVQHYDASGTPDGVSSCGFKSYVQGRQKFASDTLDFIWFDEEPPMDVYSEGLARITATGGMVYLTFTAMLGPTEVANRFYNDDSAEAGRDRELIKIGFADAKHLGPDDYDKLVGRYPTYQHAARIHGEIMLGEGAVWENIDIGMLKVPAMPLRDIPPHFRKIWGIDFGIGHPFAAVLAIHDADTDTICFVHEIRLKDALPLNHIPLLRSVAPTVPVAWPHDGQNRQEGNGEELFKHYRGTAAQPGLVMRPVHAAYGDGSYRTEAGVTDMLTRMREGRLQVADNLPMWAEEFRSYHRKNGLIVKLNDDLMSASRIACMDIRHARAVHPLNDYTATARRRSTERVELDPFTNRPIGDRMFR